ncbi:MAG TPA: 4-hydroxybutyrate--acetyl-CoA CoA transferase [Candidatus Anaerotignum merdipullorum]|nr:4-hydroxybutyrate--acetyl-CoA CoA transferase [Candidatus Anaerotignum merdipullorum]
MNQFQELYESKKGTVADALAIISDGDYLVPGYCANEPFTILGQLHTLQDREDIHHIRVLYSLANGDYPFFDKAYEQTFSMDSYFFGATNRRLYQEGRCSYIPVNLHEATKRKDSFDEPNVYIGSATPMDKHGYMRTSLGNMIDRNYMDKAEKIILEINPNLPLVNGDTEIHIRDVDRIVEVNTPIPTIPLSKIEKEDEAIGQYVASLVHDGDTIQLGIGSIPDAIALALTDKKDLGIHTEMINSGMAVLMEKGVVTNKKKTLHRGKTVGTFAFGDQHLYDWLDQNPSILMLPAEYVNNPAVIAKNDNMVAINTAMQVDLSGQVSSEGIGSKHYSGSGGQTDMSQGANHAKNGRSIIALHATAKNGTISTIQPYLTPGSVVSLSRNCVDYIVTEYGIAALKGRSVRERVENLIAIAHPKFREELREAAQQMMLW